MPLSKSAKIKQREGRCDLQQNQKRCHPNLQDKAKTYSRRRLLVIALRREETGVLVMELSEHLWPENLEFAIPVVHDVARSRQNPLLLLVIVDSDFDTPIWDFLCQILQPGILAQNRPSRVAVLTTFMEKSEAKVDSKHCTEIQIRFFSPHQECEAKAWLLSFATPHYLPPILD
jgi:stage II sporulation SpoAA-like protein